MSEKAHLNGAFYGPSIPAQETRRQKRNFHRPGRGSGGACCLLDCLCGCIFSCIFKILITILVIIGIAILVFWLIFRPHTVRFHVEEARLTTFDLSSTNNNLRYDLALNISVRNPNKRIGVYYDRIDVRAFFEDQRFGNTNVSSFYQGHENTRVLTPSFTGSQALVALGNDGLSEYNQQITSGFFDVDVKLYLRIRFKVGLVKTWRFKPRIKCELRVPLNSTSVFQRTKCDIDF